MAFKGKLMHYLGLSAEKGIITEKQKSEIMQLVVEEGGNFGFFRILGIIGSLCIGLGVLLIVASNWSSYPQYLQLGMSLSLPVVFLGIGYYFSYIQKELAILGTAFIFIGALSIGGTIALIGQMYHTGGTVGLLLMLWCILSIPLVFVFRLKLLAFLSTSLFYTAIWYHMEGGIFRMNFEKVLMIFFVVSSSLSVAGYVGNQFTKKAYHYVFFPLIIVSIKILFLTLFIGTFQSFFFPGNFGGGDILHNIIFILVALGLMWWANNNDEIILRHTTFFWIGLYMAAKYFILFDGYFSAGIFFVTGGIFLLGLVYGFVKINAFLGKQKQKDQNTL